jgi:trimeric autotransporter adhesin
VVDEDPEEFEIAQHRTVVEGTVSSVGVFSTNQSGVEGAPVTIVIIGAPAGFHSGESAEANIRLMQKMHVLTVPSAAVHASGTRTFVYELVSGRSVSHDVRVGAVGTNVTQMVSGLSDGSNVVVPN